MVDVREAKKGFGDTIPKRVLGGSPTYPGIAWSSLN